MKYIKKIFLTFFLFFISLSFSLFWKKDKPDQDNNIKVDDVYLEVEKDIEDLIKDPHEYNSFYLLFDDMRLNTKNFVDIFSKLDVKEYSIIRLYPYYSPLYKEKLDKYIEYFIFLNNDLEAGLNDFFNRYVNLLDEFGYKNEIDRVSLSGIEIRKVLIHCSNEIMYDFLKSNRNIKYSLVEEGEYKKID